MPLHLLPNNQEQLHTISATCSCNPEIIFNDGAMIILHQLVSDPSNHTYAMADAKWCATIVPEKDEFSKKTNENY